MSAVIEVNGLDFNYERHPALVLRDFSI